jgi:hypothetical protein
MDPYLTSRRSLSTPSVASQPTTPLSLAAFANALDLFIRALIRFADFVITLHRRPFLNSAIDPAASTTRLVCGRACG